CPRRRQRPRNPHAFPRSDRQLLQRLSAGSRRPLAAMWSFKLKLVLWFALLALLPLGVAFYGYDTLAKRSETRRVDAGLEAGLRGAVAAYVARLDAAGSAAQQLARDPALQRALRGGDSRTVRRILARVPGARLGNGPSSVSVVDRGRVLGRITVDVPVREVLPALARGLGGDDRLLAGRHGPLLAPPPPPLPLLPPP